MDNEIKKLIRLDCLTILVVTVSLLIACDTATKAAPDPITGSGQGAVQPLVFDRPLSNQIEMYEDNENEGTNSPYSRLNEA